MFMAVPIIALIATARLPIMRLLSGEPATTDSAEGVIATGSPPATAPANSGSAPEPAAEAG
jgi:hypothetical protein